MHDTPMLSRPRNPDAKTVELRGEIDAWIVAVLDGVSISRNVSRTAVVAEVLGAWANQEHHRASLVLKLAGANPTASESSGRAT